MIFTMGDRLKEMDRLGKSLKVGIVGAGKMGRGLVSQMSYIRGMAPSVLINRTPEKAIEAFKIAGIDESDIIHTNSLDKISFALERGRYVVSEYSDLIGRIDGLDGVVDATGGPEAGANIALDTIESGKHMIMLNVETDSAIGPILYEKARKNNVIYTGTAGDEPGSAMELYNFANNLGFDVLAMGKGKNNPINLYVTPDEIREEALSKGLKATMLAGFIDGTNTMIEMTAMANATGFVSDIRGGHGVKSDIDNLTKTLSLKRDGGVLNDYGIVDYVLGIAPGVFVIFTTESKELKEQLKYVSMGDGPNYVLYRPYHLTSMETPITIYEACVNKSATIAPSHGQVTDAIAVAKKDLKAGECLDTIGGYTFYGSIEKHNTTIKEKFLPVCLIDEKTRVLRDIKKDEFISYDMVELDESKTITKLRREQDRILG